MSKHYHHHHPPNIMLCCSSSSGDGIKKTKRKSFLVTSSIIRVSWKNIGILIQRLLLVVVVVVVVIRKSTTIIIHPYWNCYNTPPNHHSSSYRSFSSSFWLVSSITPKSFYSRSRINQLPRLMQQQQQQQWWNYPKQNSYMKRYKENPQQNLKFDGTIILWNSLHPNQWKENHIRNNDDDTTTSTNNNSKNNELSSLNWNSTPKTRRVFCSSATTVVSATVITSTTILGILRPSVAASISSTGSTVGNGMSMNVKSSTSSSSRRMGGLASKIRGISLVMDELQRDLMQERWDLVEMYPAQLRSFVPIFTSYTDSAFPTDAPTDKGLRVALRYEVGRLFASVERMKQATTRQSLEEAYLAYAEMSLHYDRYLRVGGLYTYYDDTISNEPYFAGISDAALVYADPAIDPPLVRDLAILIQGPDKGKTGIVIGMYTDGSNKSVIKLDRYKGLREIRVVPNSWVAKRVGEQAPDDVFLIPRKGGLVTASNVTPKATPAATGYIVQ